MQKYISLNFEIVIFVITTYLNEIEVVKYSKDEDIARPLTSILLT